MVKNTMAPNELFSFVLYFLCCKVQFLARKLNKWDKLKLKLNNIKNTKV